MSRFRRKSVLALVLVVTAILFPNIVAAAEPDGRPGRTDRSSPAAPAVTAPQSVSPAEAVPAPVASPSAVAAAAQRPLSNPRQAMQTFILASEQRDYRQAVSVLDFSALIPPPDPFEQIRLAQQLKACIDRLALVDLEQLSNQPDGPPRPFPPGKPDSPIVLCRGEDGQWRFSATTVQELGALFDLVKDRPVLGDVLVPPAKPVATEPAAKSRPASDMEPAADAGSDRAVPAAAVPSALSSARRTMRTLLESLQERDYPQAIATLDFSQLEAEQGEIGQYARIEYARQLQSVLERMALIDFGQISDDPEGPSYYFPPDAPSQPIEITRGEAGVWRFSASTVAHIHSLYELYRDRPVLNLPEAERPWYARELVSENEVWRVLVLFAAVFVSLTLGNLLRWVFQRRAAALQKRQRMIRAVVMTTLAKTVVAVLFLAGLESGIQVLILNHEVERIAATIIHVVFALVVGYICFRLVDVAVELLRQMASKTGSTLNDMLVPIVSASLRVTIIALVVLEIAAAVSNQPPSAMIAGLGTAGLAIGLAAQDMIKNFFGSLMIYADRPFELGDRIIFDGHDGPVETVGFRSTRIRTLDGHLVTVPNGEMAHKTIHNIGKRPYIRRVMEIRIPYDTPPDKVDLALATLRELLADHEGMKPEYPPRVFLHEFLESALSIRAIYWYHPPNYWQYVAFGEGLNLQIVRRFQQAGITFALPAQRLFLAERDGPQQTVR